MTAPLSKCADRFIETMIDDEAVVMDMESGDFSSLTGTALAVWQLIDGTRSRDAIVSALAADFAAEPAMVAADVDDFLGKLKAAGFVSDG